MGSAFLGFQLGTVFVLSLLWLPQRTATGRETPGDPRGLPFRDPAHAVPGHTFPRGQEAVTSVVALSLATRGSSGVSLPLTPVDKEPRMVRRAEPRAEKTAAQAGRARAAAP